MSNLNDFVIENGVLKKYSGNDTDVVIPEGVTKIGASAFYGCTSLTKLTIPEGVKIIEAEAFHCCSNLKSITIPDSVTSIEDSAFYECKNLTSITIPDGVTSIGDTAFYGCTSLANITIPDSVTSVGDSAFKDCEKLADTDGFVIVRNVLYHYSGNEKNVLVPDSVTSIGIGAFMRCTSLTNITIPDSVTSIRDSAFFECKNLTSITIPDGVTSIGDTAFHGCTSLTDITIPEGVTRIASEIFEGCTSLTNITIPDSVTRIWYNAFYGCENLTGITISDMKLLPKELRMLAIIGFARNSHDDNKTRYDKYVKYIKSNAEKLVDLAVSFPELLFLMCDKKLITAKNIELYVQKANESNNPEIISMILDYQNSSITQKQKDAVEKKKEQRENEIFDRMVARSGKEGIEGLKFVISGDVETFKNRAELTYFIKSKGGKVASSISSKVDYLITNDADLNSQKIKDAKALGIEVISEREFNDKVGR